MKVGAEDKKKVALLAALSAVAVVTVYVQFFSSDAQSGAAPLVPASACVPAISGSGTVYFMLPPDTAATSGTPRPVASGS